MEDAIMHMKWRPRGVTFVEFCKEIPDGQKADLIDGVVHMASPDSWEASVLFTWLFNLISTYVFDRDLGQVVGSRTAFRLADDSGPEPDIAFVQTSRLDQARRGFFEGPPDLAIEIVSESSVDRDYIEKRELYRRAGVREYWIIDPLLEKVTLLRLDARGRYRVVRPSHETYSSDVLPEFWFKPDWLWQDPLPRLRDTIDVILR